MPVYLWKGKNTYGEKRKGKLEVPSEDGVRSHLKKMRITPSMIKEAPKDLCGYPHFSAQGHR